MPTSMSNQLIYLPERLKDWSMLEPWKHLRDMARLYGCPGAVLAEIRACLKEYRERGTRNEREFARLTRAVETWIGRPLPSNEELRAARVARAFAEADRLHREFEESLSDQLARPEVQSGVAAMRRHVEHDLGELRKYDQSGSFGEPDANWFARLWREMYQRAREVGIPAALEEIESSLGDVGAPGQTTSGHERRRPSASLDKIRARGRRRRLRERPVTVTGYGDALLDCALRLRHD
jgi:hypothetical protein